MYNCHPVYTNNDQYYLYYYSFSMEGWRVGTRTEYTSGYSTYYSYSYNMYQYSYTTGHTIMFHSDDVFIRASNEC